MKGKMNQSAIQLSAFLWEYNFSESCEDTMFYTFFEFFQLVYISTDANYMKQHLNQSAQNYPQYLHAKLRSLTAGGFSTKSKNIEEEACKTRREQRPVRRRTVSCNTDHRMATTTLFTQQSGQQFLHLHQQWTNRPPNYRR